MKVIYALLGLLIVGFGFWVGPTIVVLSYNALAASVLSGAVEGELLPASITWVQGFFVCMFFIGANYLNIAMSAK